MRGAGELGGAGGARGQKQLHTRIFGIPVARILLYFKLLVAKDASKVPIRNHLV